MPVVIIRRPLARCHHRSGSSGGTAARLKIAVKRSQRSTSALVTRRSAPTTAGIRACNEQVTGILHGAVSAAPASRERPIAAGPAFPPPPTAPRATRAANPGPPPPPQERAPP